MSHSVGKCPVCNDYLIPKDLKLKNTFNQFKRIYCCKSKIRHTHSQEEIDQFDIAYYKNMEKV